jgi:serine protease Do
MIGRFALLSTCCAAIWCADADGVQAQEVNKLAADRITPVVRVVQKCQGAVVAFLSPKSGKPMGTGVIVDERGIIVTNAHVVGDTQTWKIQLIDKTEIVGEVVELKGKSDLALVKVSTKHPLDVLPPCKSDKVYLGEEVVAIGHPYGYSYSITRGILSATGRDIPLPNGGVISEAYQIDAPINPGNSGGPLMNVNGELIGINFAMRTEAQSIAFTIPAKTVRKLLSNYSE